MRSGPDELLIDFGVTGNSSQFCRSGWSQSEPNHTWTIGRESTIELSRPDSPGDYCIVLELGPFVWKEDLPAQRLSVLVNGTAIGDFQVREVTQVECAIPWSLLESRETVSIVFVHPDAAKPSRMNGVADHREIAFAFERLRFRRLPDDKAQPDGTTHSGLYGASQTATLAPNQLMMQFESLGENCEFGLVQRRCGAEPLGLLRFASAPLPKLLAALRAKFDGLGDPAQIKVQVSCDQSEYLVIDGRFGLLYHPWILVAEATPGDIWKREAMRLPFLRRKLLEDLHEGRKIFVYHGMTPLAEPDALCLHAAIRSHGPGTLLWVELQDATHPPGTVEVVVPGLLKGYIDRFAPGENAHDLSLEVWITICRNAIATSCGPPV